jgi:hypothetical protein
MARRSRRHLEVAMRMSGNHVQGAVKQFKLFIYLSVDAWISTTVPGGLVGLQQWATLLSLNLPRIGLHLVRSFLQLRCDIQRLKLSAAINRRFFSSVPIKA